MIGTQSDQDWPYLRYAEILLTYAEAQNEAVGPDASVYSAVNAVRGRASVSMTYNNPAFKQTPGYN